MIPGGKKTIIFLDTMENLARMGLYNDLYLDSPLLRTNTTTNGNRQNRTIRKKTNSRADAVLVGDRNAAKLFLKFMLSMNKILNLIRVVRQ
jgi:hypothetical protein